MNISSIKYLTSSAKWKKAALLVKERRLMAHYAFTWLLRVQARSSSNTWTEGSTNSSKGNNSTVESSEVQSAKHSWSYTSSLVMPAQIVDRVVSRFSQDQVLDDGSFRADYEYQTAMVHEALFYTNGTSHVSAFDRHRQRMNTFSYAKYNVNVTGNCKLVPKRRLTGTTLSIYGNVEHANGNFGHWMVDGIARLLMALKYHQISDIDQVLVPRLRYDFQLDSLLQLGISQSQIVEVDALECIQCERLILTSAPRGHSSSATPGWLIDGFRDILLPPKAKVNTAKRIYISRRDARSRKFVDEELIISCLEGYGFEAVEMSTFNFEEKIALFANAEMIIGLSGAGLTNAMFCQKDAVLIELLPESHLVYFYTSMCCYLGLDYHAIVFSSNSLVNNINKLYANLYLKPQVITDKLDEILKVRGKTTH